MSSAELAAWLLSASVALTVSILLVAALRTPMRTHFGSASVLALWWLPVLVLVATVLPVSLRPSELIVDIIEWIPLSTMDASSPPDVASGAGWSQWCVALVQPVRALGVPPFCP